MSDSVSTSVGVHAEASASNSIGTFRILSADDQSPAVLGSTENFWRWDAVHGYDLTRRRPSDLGPETPPLRLQCALTPILIDPAKAALLVIDMQNYNISRALGNEVKAYYDTEAAIANHALPAARVAGIQVIWLTWGLTDQDLRDMDPGVFRTFGWHSVPLKNPPDNTRPGERARKDGERRNQKGVGDDLGQVTLEDGSIVDGGRVLMRGTWNAQLHGPLAESYAQSLKSARPDVNFFKNRNSGMCDKMTACTDYLVREGIKTLLFTGINTDQCVMGTLQDANLKVFDCVMLKDGCGTNSPEFAQLSAEYNCLRSWGFLSTCRDLAEAVKNMK